MAPGSLSSPMRRRNESKSAQTPVTTGVAKLVPDRSTTEFRTEAPITSLPGAKMPFSR